MFRILLVSFLSVSLIHAEDINDPFEDINRITFKFNESLDNNFLKPVALTYSKTPKPIKKGISNFFDNLEEIETSVNQILQGKPKLAINDFSRFIINSTIGLGGFLDVATKIGLTRHEEEFDQTLALWGVPSGPYIMLPGLGPSTLRDTLARPFSSFLSVTFHMTESDVNLALKGMDALETRERLLEIESLIYGDRYNFVRDSYFQYMNYEINDGVDVEDEFIDDMDDLLIEQ
ncbi:MAG: VacJ family lipoprotein [Proteobacteria bacterium]|jgi:phospholipid-binding lipoprotein MlaA|nr:VacJ family lipoprotein [Pseudomonadota bacterium]MDA0949896.1 VacJ family lipoprotein [Pseudomonadota bacterium]MDA1083208.1 VacJ family lipoprotein [Pseudomonadota bacterium]